MAQLSDDCFAFGGALLPLEEARRLIVERVKVVADVETVALMQADGRTLAEAVAAPRDVPGFTNSAVDGYAVRFDDLSPDAETRLVRDGRIAAGQTPADPLAAGRAARIFTGAALPVGADTVIMQEDCREDGDMVLIRPGIRLGANRRLAGEDIAAGSVALAAGRRLGPAELGMLAALGQSVVPVRRRLSVALFSTGDELREPGQSLAAGQIYDANRFMLASMLVRAGVVVSDRGILPDRPGALAEALVDAAARHDLIVTSGGVSTGEEDHVRNVIASHGSLFFWRLAIKPGRPVALGQIGGTPLIGLPGNPVAALVTFAAVARPLIEAMTGMLPRVPRRFAMVSGFSYRKKAGRREYVRVSVEAGDGGRLRRFPKEGAGMLTSLTETDGLAELPESMTQLEPGMAVDFIPYGEML
ncbi:MULTISPECIES: molybdopterin molybdotransferase MoeA [Inquilinus]|uniref:Molybdopterin molybdenumtransferase n=1 Tax=Inquilinus ginsengisoli TaxID=363840 RepID=A0ABU1JTC6_9PROT|nr:gephyrin-like molybdotransferase Glp [Inquilinus ginsengisoli]MDR6291876.1 molybdopterin molybdotransferase [Inquilinus ginsengisoli]